MLEYFDLPLRYRLGFEGMNGYNITPIYAQSIRFHKVGEDRPLLWLRDNDVMCDNYCMIHCRTFSPVALGKDWNSGKYYLLADNGSRYEVAHWSSNIMTLENPESALGEGNWLFVNVYPSTIPLTTIA